MTHVIGALYQRSKFQGESFTCGLTDVGHAMDRAQASGCCVMKSFIVEGRAAKLLVSVALMGLVSSVINGSERVRAGEGMIRRAALKGPKPPFPPDAVRRREMGVAVSEIEIDEAGNVSRVVVLEAPSAGIATAVAATLNTWTFREFKARDGTPRVVVGKITFYFVLRDGTAAVMGPDEAPYVGRWSQSGKTRVPRTQ